MLPSASMANKSKPHVAMKRTEEVNDPLSLLVLYWYMILRQRRNDEERKGDVNMFKKNVSGSDRGEKMDIVISES